MVGNGMSQLSDIQNEILKRFKQPLPMDNQRQGVAANDQPASLGSVAPQPSAPSQPGLPPARPSTASPYTPPAAMQPPTPTVNQPTSIDMSGAGSPPARINAQTGEPHRETFDGDPESSAYYRDALQRWKPTHHHSLGQVAKEFAIGAANAVNTTGNPWSAIGGGGAGVVSGVVQPNVINRAYKLNRANADVERVAGERRNQAQTDAISGQQDAREAAILAGRERIRQGDERLHQGADRLNQTGRIAHQRMLASTYNTLKEFDPGDPSNARLVAEFTKEMGYPPPRKTSGSMLQVEEGEDAQGNPTFSVIDKGTGTATSVTGDLPATTNNQANRDSRETQGALNRQNRTDNVNTQQAGANNQAAQRRPVSPALTRRAAALVGQIDQARAAMSSGKTQADKDNAKAYGIKAASELKALNAGYDAGVGPDGWPMYSQQSASAPSPTEDPMIRKYANQHFKGDYKRALEAARATGYSQ